MARDDVQFKAETADAAHASHAAHRYLFLDIRGLEVDGHFEYSGNVTTIHGKVIHTAGPYLLQDLAEAKATQWVALSAPAARLVLPIFRPFPIPIASERTSGARGWARGFATRTSSPASRAPSALTVPRFLRNLFGFGTYRASEMVEQEANIAPALAVDGSVPSQAPMMFEPPDR